MVQRPETQSSAGPTVQRNAGRRAGVRKVAGRESRHPTGLPGEQGSAAIRTRVLGGLDRTPEKNRGDVDSLVGQKLRQLLYTPISDIGGQQLRFGFIFLPLMSTLILVL
jgi:hypothetical protein